jgi:hypothetical protein
MTYEDHFCGDCGHQRDVAHECDPHEVYLMKVIKVGQDKREAEEAVIEAADAFYDLAHTITPELRMVEQWKEVSRRIDETVRELRKVRTRERALHQP